MNDSEGQLQLEATIASDEVTEVADVTGVWSEDDIKSLSVGEQCRYCALSVAEFEGDEADFFTATTMDAAHQELEVARIEFDIYLHQLEAFNNDPNLFAELVYSRLSSKDKELFMEAKARERSEFMRESAVRQCIDEAERKEA